MRVLLDSHAVIWFLTDDPRMSSRANAVLDDNSNRAFVSAASAWEICTKHRIGKLPQAGELSSDFERAIVGRGFLTLDVTTRHAALAGNLSGSHKDPFDRMLVAQALSENLTLLSNDAAFDAFGVTRLW